MARIPHLEHPDGSHRRVLILRADASKLGNVSATYLPLKTCPVDCGNKAICYASDFRVGLIQRKLDESRPDWTPGDWGRFESLSVAAGINAGLDVKPLRLRVSGEHTVSNILEHTCRWRSPVWTYSHRWRELRSAEIASARLSMLASVETVEAMEEAREAGWAPAMSGPQPEPPSGEGLIHCPQQTHNVTCDRCGLCWKASMLAKKGRGIYFAWHGAKARRALVELRKR